MVGATGSRGKKTLVGCDPPSAPLLPGPAPRSRPRAAAPSPGRAPAGLREPRGAQESPSGVCQLLGVAPNTTSRCFKEGY